MDIDTIINFWRIDEHFSSFILGIKLILIRIKNHKTDKKLHGLERSIKGLDNMRTDGLALVLILGGGANFLFYTSKVFIIILELFN